MPAFPANDQQFYGLISMPFGQMWVGINDIEDEGVHMDLFNKRSITIKPEWYTMIDGHQFVGPKRETSDCILIVNDRGVMNRDCLNFMGYICEYWP